MEMEALRRAWPFLFVPPEHPSSITGDHSHTLNLSLAAVQGVDYLNTHQTGMTEEVFFVIMECEGKLRRVRPRKQMYIAFLETKENPVFH